MKLVPNQMQSIRERYGLRQYQVAKKIGVSPQVYSRYESGERSPDLDTIKDLADFYKLPETFFWIRKHNFEDYTYRDSLTDLGTIYDFEYSKLRYLLKKYKKSHAKRSAECQVNSEYYSDDEETVITKYRLKKQSAKIVLIQEKFHNIFEEKHRTLGVGNLHRY